MSCGVYWSVPHVECVDMMASSQAESLLCEGDMAVCQADQPPVARVSCLALEEG